VRVERSGKGGRRWRCGFNASALARERMRRDEALPKDEAEQQARFGSMGRKRDMAQWRGDVGWRRGGT
jgi:hypothetical protein